MLRKLFIGIIVQFIGYPGKLNAIGIVTVSSNKKIILEINRQAVKALG